MRIKLLQWNILHKEKVENIVKTIKKLKPDIVCLQELGFNSIYNPLIPNTAEFIKKGLEHHAFFQEAQRWKMDDEIEAIGNGIFSHFPITRTFSKYVQGQTKKFTDYSHEGRIYIEADLKVNGEILTVGTTHLSYVKEFKITEEKKQEVDKLLNIIKDKKSRYVFTGDLNSTPESYTIEKLSKYFQNCGPSFDQCTWTTKPFDYDGFKEDKTRWRIDYVFATKDIKCISSKIVKTKYSDHLPIVCLLEV